MQYYYIPENEALYMDATKGHFSKSLAEWAISKMRTKNNKGELVKLSAMSLEDVEDTLKRYNVQIEDASIYDAWYLYNMCLADYRKALPQEEHIVKYIYETINDPDGDPTAVLACFRAKMDVKGTPIYWERFL